VDEAHNFGLKVAVHAHGPEGIKAAIRAGAASIEHGTLMDDEGRSLMKQHGTYLVPTLEVRECVGTNYPAEFVAKANEVLAAQLQNFRKAVTGKREDCFWHRHRGLPVRPQRTRIQPDGAQWHDFHAGDPVGYRGRC